MAPEQAKGRAADKRSDVWAFGCVLYEMLTGRRAFEGDGVSDTLAAVLRGEPDWTALPSGVPPLVRTLVQRCLKKDRNERIADFSIASFMLTGPDFLASAALPGACVDRRSRRRCRTTSLVVVQHFDEELKRLLPTR
jgi:serine/threonine protein kinase